MDERRQPHPGIRHFWNGQHEPARRGVGPDLSAFGISDPATAVGVDIFDANGTPSPRVSEQQRHPDGSIAADVGDFPLTQAGDSATTVSLAPGAYTVIATPDPTVTANGVALLEVDDVDGSM